MTTTPATQPSDTPTGQVRATMTAIVARTYGGPEVLALEEVPVPTPSEGQVLVRVAAASLNAADWRFLTGTPYLMRLVSGLRRPKHAIRGADVAGTVVRVGVGVTHLRPGDRVFGEWIAGGGCAPYVAVGADCLAPLPEAVSFEAAAATPMAGLTALQALRTHAQVRPGDRVLVNGAAGGVGTFTVQVARALGAEVTGVCSTRNVEMVQALGAEAVDYTSDDVMEGGERFDVMVDVVGNRSPAECKAVLRPGGRYVAVSGPMENRWLGPLPHIVRTWLAFVRSGRSFHQFTESMDAEDLGYLAELLVSGEVVPQIERVVGFDGVAEALAEIGTGHTKAKIVVVPG